MNANEVARVFIARLVWRELGVPPGDPIAEVADVIDGLTDDEADAVHDELEAICEVRVHTPGLVMGADDVYVDPRAHEAGVAVAVLVAVTERCGGQPADVIAESLEREAAFTREWEYPRMDRAHAAPRRWSRN